MEFIIWVLLGITGAIIATGRGHSAVLWFILGFLLGPFALVWSFFLKQPEQAGDQVLSVEPGIVSIPSTPVSPPSPPRKWDNKAKAFVDDIPKYSKCPKCANVILSEAVMCQYCHTEFGQPLWQILIKNEPKKELSREW